MSSNNHILSDVWIEIESTRERAAGLLKVKMETWVEDVMGIKDEEYEEVTTKSMTKVMKRGTIV